MTTKLVGHTPGALRAAQKLVSRVYANNNQIDIEVFAGIIDRETAASELLEALEMMIECLKYSGISVEDSIIMTAALSAIRKARGE